MALTLRNAATVAAALLLTACTTHKQEAPPLTGPSAMGTSIVLTASPDVLALDGASQSLLQIQAYDSNGQPLRNVAMRLDVAVDNSITDYGTLSAKNVVTDTAGRASAVYTAPKAPTSNARDTTVQLLVTPLGGDFANSTPRVVNIRLTPPGVVAPPTSPLVVTFDAPSPTVGNASVFQANVTDADGNDATNQIVSYEWDFGDGSTASGRSVTHTFTTPKTYQITLRVTDNLNRTNTIYRSITVGQGALPTAQIETPSSAQLFVGQEVHFNASGSTAEPGHRIVEYSWNFGDGDLGSGALVTHVFDADGDYTVTLKVTDDVGRKSQLATKTVSIKTDLPTVQFTYTPTAPSAPTGSFASVILDASGSKVVAGRTIVSNEWNVVALGTGAQAVQTGSSTDGKQTTVTYDLKAPGIYSVTLTVTDSTGKKNTATQNITVAASAP
jgi:PKD repeat protein